MEATLWIGVRVIGNRRLGPSISRSHKCRSLRYISEFSFLVKQKETSDLQKNYEEAARDSHSSVPFARPETLFLLKHSNFHRVSVHQHPKHSKKMRTKQTHRKSEIALPFQNPKMHERKKAHDVKHAICRLLDNFESGGTFATSGVYSEAPLPDLSLQGYGGIPLPLAQRDAEAICKERTEGEHGML